MEISNRDSENAELIEKRLSKRKLSKNALRRRFNFLLLQRNTRFLKLQEACKKHSTTVECNVSYTNESNNVLVEQISSRNYNSCNKSEISKIGTNSIKSVSNSGGAAVCNVNDKEKSSNVLSSIDSDNTHKMPFESQESLLYVLNGNENLSNEDIESINKLFNDVCIFCEFIQLKIKQISTRKTVIKSFTEIEPTFHTLFRFLRKCEKNFKHFKLYLVKNYLSLYENFMKQNNNDKHDETKSSLNNDDLEKSSTQSNTNESIDRLLPESSKHEDKNKSEINMKTEGSVFSSNDCNIQEVSVTVERGEIKFPEFFKKISKSSSDTDDEISRLVNLNSLKRHIDSHNTSDVKSKKPKLMKPNETQNEEKCSLATMSETSENEAKELIDNRTTPDLCVNDLASREILELSDNSNSNDYLEKIQSESEDNTKESTKYVTKTNEMKKEENLDNDSIEELTDKTNCQNKSFDKIELDLFDDSSDRSSECETINKKLNKSDDVCYVSSSNDGEISEGLEKGRKNIRDIIDEKNLEHKTQMANKDERKRLERLAMRDRRINLNTVKNDHFVIDRDLLTNEVLVSVHPLINKHLKDHQREGIKFMWDNCYESLEALEAKGNKGNGCILAHCMGLGKTLQVIAFSHMILTHKRCLTKSILIVCPSSVTLNWKDEIQKWLQPFPDLEKQVYVFINYKDIKSRCRVLRQWQTEGGFMLLSYTMYQSVMKQLPLLEDKKKLSAKCLRETLQNPGPDIVFLDEGHVLKNEKSLVRKKLEEIRTRRRVILTGTPMQNNLREYFWMLHFVKPFLLGSFKEFSNRFANPIRNGQHKNSNINDIKLMKRRSHVLHKLLKGTVQRKEVSVLKKYLPKKYEFVLLLKPSKIQEKLYNGFLVFFGQKQSVSKQLVAAKFFSDFQTLKRIWTHPYALVDFLEKNQALEKKETNKLSMDVDEIIDDADSQNICKVINQLEKPWLPHDWWKKFASKDEINTIQSSSKLSIMFDIIQECQNTNEKVLVFSSSINVLNTIEHFLKIITEVTNSSEIKDHSIVGKYRGIWLNEKDYFRFDGQLPVIDRRKYCNTFNDSSNKRARLFLVSTRAGGIGLNMIGANRVIILDVSWNPAVDTQSIFRTYRLQQTKICYVYRVIAAGFMEQKIYERSVTKEALSCRVVDEQQIGRHYTTADLSELYTLYRPLPSVQISKQPDDKLLANILSGSSSGFIHSYHEHDSLLTDIEEEKLLPEERESAWQEFLQEEYKSNANQQTPTNNSLTTVNILPSLQNLEQQQFMLKKQPTTNISPLPATNTQTSKSDQITQPVQLVLKERPVPSQHDKSKTNKLPNQKDFIEKSNEPISKNVAKQSNENHSFGYLQRTVLQDDSDKISDAETIIIDLNDKDEIDKNYGIRAQVDLTLEDDDCYIVKDSS